MARQYYSRRHYERLCPTPDRPGDAERRIREQQLRQQAYDEAVARFGEVTPENAREWIDWQNERTHELLYGRGS